MKAMAVNGSPRKNWNTATLLGKTLEGAASRGAETESVHLYDLDYKGCTSCFACKMAGNPTRGRCVMKDGLAPVLDRIVDGVDVLVLGSPVYFGNVTGQMRCFMERLLFAPLVYSKDYMTVFPRRLPTAFIHTMNVTEEQAVEFGYDRHFTSTKAVLERILGGPSAILTCTDTLQFEDYSCMIADRFDPEAKAARHRDVFPLDCKRAFDLGVQLADLRARTA